MVLWVLGLIYTSFELSWHQHRALYIATANYWVEFTEHQQQISLSQGQIGMYGQGHVGNRSKKLHVPKLPPSSDRHLNKDFKKWTKISVLSFSFFMASDEISKCFLRTTCSIGKYGTEDWLWTLQGMGYEDSQKGPTIYSSYKLSSFSWGFPARRIDSYWVKMLYLKDGLLQRDPLLMQSIRVLKTRVFQFWVCNWPKWRELINNCF